MKFHPRLERLFSHEELLILFDACAVYTTDEEEAVDFMLFTMQNEFRAEIRCDLKEDQCAHIYDLRMDAEEEFMDKQVLMDAVTRGIPKEMHYLEVE